MMSAIGSESVFVPAQPNWPATACGWRRRWQPYSRDVLPFSSSLLLSIDAVPVARPTDIWNVLWVGT